MPVVTLLEPLGCSPSRSRCRHPSLLNRTCDGRKDIVCIGADQSDRAYDKDKNYRQHHRVLGNVLAFLVTAYVPKHIEHVPPLASEVRVANCKKLRGGWRTAERVDHERSGWPSPQIRRDCAPPAINLSTQKPCPTRLLAHPTSLEHPSTNHAKSATQVASDGHLRLESPRSRHKQC